MASRRNLLLAISTNPMPRIAVRQKQCHFLAFWKLLVGTLSMLVRFGDLLEHAGILCLPNIWFLGVRPVVSCVPRKRDLMISSSRPSPPPITVYSAGIMQCMQAGLRISVFLTTHLTTTPANRHKAHALHKPKGVHGTKASERTPRPRRRCRIHRGALRGGSMQPVPRYPSAP